MPQRLTRLTVETIDGVLEGVLEQNAESLDLRDVRFVDPYALLLLELLVLEAAENRRAPRIEWPEASVCLLYTSPSPRDATLSRMPSSA